MKKGLVVLLIAVLALGAVFADVTSFTGKLTSAITWDLDNESLIFDQSAEAKAKFNFGLFAGSSAEKAAQGEGYPYAVIEGALAINFEDFVFSFGDIEDTARYSATDNFWNHAYGAAEIKGYDAKAKDGVEITPQMVQNEIFKKYDVTDIRFSWAQDGADKVITTAKIVGEKWELDLLENFGVGNFATNAIADSYEFKASTKVKSKVAYDMDNSTEDGNGVTFTYDGYKVAVNRFKFFFDNGGNNDFELSFQTKDFEFEGVTGTAAINFQSKGTANNSSVTNSANLSVKAGYEVSDFVLAAASDVRIATEAEDTEFDVAFAADYKEGAVKFDFYYASEADAVSPYENAKDVNKAVADLSFDYTGAVGGKASFLFKYKNKGDAVSYDDVGIIYYIKNLMSLKAVVDVAKLADLGPVSALSVTVDGHDILNKDVVAAGSLKNAYAWNAEANAALEDYGTTAKFGVKEFTVDARRFYAEATTDFAKFAELPVNTLTLTVGSNDLDMDANVQDKTDCLYVTVASDINDDLSVSVKGNYLAGKERTDKITVEATYTGVEKLTLGAKVAHEFAGNNKGTFVEATAKYEHDLFTADAKIQTKLYKDSDSDTFGLYVGATSDKIVHGATLSLAYSGLDDDGKVKNDWCDHKFDKVVAKCVIAF